MTARILGILLAAASVTTAPEEFSAERNGPTLTLKRGDRVVAVYQLENRVFPKAPVQDRCGCFPELRSPSGRILTQDGPYDHPHHRGLFLAWNEVAWSRDPDKGWELKANFWELTEKSGRKGPAAVVGEPKGGAAASFGVRHDWRIGEQKILQETLSCRVSAPSDNVYALDLDFLLETSEGSVLLDEYGHHDATGRFYGALSMRAAAAYKNEPMKFAYSDGADHAEVENGRFEGDWVGFHGKIDGADCGAVIASQSGNPPVRLSHWPKLRFISADITAMKAVRIDPGKPLRLRYRVLLFDGDPEAAKVADLVKAE